ncbi:MAG: DUF2807 domain-containing protein [Candidatus Symbiothrix sp.]|jgi:hypothetical protein|nr:DUF2807 domain-containing protein [Candidatus Symbiothrix sp.]
MKTKSLALLLIISAFFGISAMAQTVKETREVGSFRKISAGSAIDVYFAQSDSKSLRVEAENVDLKEIITKIEGETLVIKRESQKISWNLKKKKQVVKVYVSAPTLEEISISGASDFYADDLKSSKSFKISASGASDIHIGNLTVAETTGISSSGGADCNIKNLKTSNCSLSSSGGSDLNIGLEVSDNLSVSTSGGSDVKLSGKANQVSVSVSGGSDIYIKDLTYNQLDSKKSGGSDIHI